MRERRSAIPHKGSPTKPVLVFAIIAVMSLVAISCSAEPATPSSEDRNGPAPRNFKVAFLSEQTLDKNTISVLELIRGEEADMVLNLGDLESVRGDADGWDRQINSVLGAEFPYFALVGNHDLVETPLGWAPYQAKLLERLDKIDGAQCAGDLGVKSVCSYKGLFFILSGVGLTGTAHTQYIKDQLAKDDSIWRICSWHVNMSLMQVTDKEDEAGWGPYEACREGGAIIATGHSHAYARSHLMDNFETQSVVSSSNELALEKGKSFVFVSGVGGFGLGPLNDELAAKPWWAATYVANFGALFCTFNEIVETQAHCYLKDIDGFIQDEFFLESLLGRDGPDAAMPRPGLSSSQAKEAVQDLSGISGETAGAVEDRSAIRKVVGTVYRKIFRPVENRLPAPTRENAKVFVAAIFGIGFFMGALVLALPFWFLAYRRRQHNRRV